MCARQRLPTLFRRNHQNLFIEEDYSLRNSAEKCSKLKELLNYSRTVTVLSALVRLTTAATRAVLSLVELAWTREGGPVQRDVL